ncbi:hypothetical protein [Caproiciproducens sp. MSJ-32]|uniref:hypothetical protein n=1 Tax=Caproiciproducens sp. MSJ-32 TaxID=2841527 RepID=UPI001C11679B|nr:hypothetical protein [Caproiciproducens sp. MSJ-32]MBU5455408.1 hypothetical protein [Caproiciproducens sp. MSJ-32]
MSNTVKGLAKTGSSLALMGYGLKTMHSVLTGSTKGFLTANSKYVFLGMFPVPNSVIIMLILSGVGLVYVWHVNVNIIFNKFANITFNTFD